MRAGGTEDIMKTLRVLALCVIGLCFISCSKDPGDEPQLPPDPGTISPEQPGTTTDLTVSLPYDIDKGNLQVAGSSFTIQISSPDDWKAEKTESWISISPDKGSKGSHEVKVVFEANPTGTSRAATIKFTSGSMLRIFDFKQDARTLSVTQDSFMFPSSGGSINVTVSTNMPDDTKVEVYSDFISFVSKGGDIYTFQLAENHNRQSRSTKIKITNGDLIQWIAVDQNGKTSTDGNGSISDIPTVPVNPF